MTDKADWKPIADATRASGRADCGHKIANGTLWLRVERAGGVREVHSLCVKCFNPQTDYMLSKNSDLPYRMSRQYLR